MGSELKNVKFYTEDDIRKAFNIGLETSLVIFEDSIHLTKDGQRKLIVKLKEKFKEEEHLFEIDSS